jgi:hypothetical protein
MVAGEVVLLAIAGVVWEALTGIQAIPGPVANPGPPRLSELSAAIGQGWILRQITWKQGPSL